MHSIADSHTSCTSDHYVEPAVFIGLWILMFVTHWFHMLARLVEFHFNNIGEYIMNSLRQNARGVSEWSLKAHAQGDEADESVQRGSNVSATDALLSRWRSQLDHCAMSVHWMHGEEFATPRPSAYFWTIRSFDRFCQKNPHGLVSADTRRFEAPRLAFYLSYVGGSYWQLFKNVSGSVLQKTWRHAVMSALWAGLLEWGYFHIKCRDEEFSTTVRDAFAGVIHVHEALLPLVSFLLTVYVTNRMSKHTEIIFCCKGFRAKMNCLALYIGGITPNSPHTNLAFKYKVFRWLSMLHFFVYAEMVEHLRDYKEFHWFSKGLLTLEEARLLARATRGGKVDLMFSWLVQHLNTGSESSNERQRVEGQRMLNEVREACEKLKDIVEWIPPISEAQLIVVINEFFITITPISLTMSNADASRPAYVWGMAGSAFLSLFFVGLLNMVRIVEDAFGEDLDDLLPDALLWSTELQFQAYLLFREPPEGLRPSGDALQALRDQGSGGKPKDKGMYMNNDGTEIMGRRKCDCMSGGPLFEVLVVQVYTGARTFAGTDASVWIQMFGNDGDAESPKYMLDRSESVENPFEYGTLDVFTIPWSTSDIEKIDIGHEGGGNAAAWFLDKVVIQSSKDGRTWEFECFDWIDITSQDPGWRTYLPKRRWLPPANWPAVSCPFQPKAPAESHKEPTGQLVKANDKSAWGLTNEERRGMDEADVRTMGTAVGQRRNSLMTLSLIPVDSIMKLIDTNGDGVIDAQEIEGTLASAGFSEEKVAKLMAELGPRSLTKADLPSFCDRLETAARRLSQPAKPIGAAAAVPVPIDELNAEKESASAPGSQHLSASAARPPARTANEAQRLRAELDGVEAQLAALAESKARVDSQLLPLLQQIEVNMRQLAQRRRS